MNGYTCYLTINERTLVKNLIKNSIKEYTKLAKKSNPSTDWKARYNIYKRRLAKIYSKMEHLIFFDDKILAECEKSQNEEKVTKQNGFRSGRTTKKESSDCEKT